MKTKLQQEFSQYLPIVLGASLLLFALAVTARPIEATRFDAPLQFAMMEGEMGGKMGGGMPPDNCAPGSDKCGAMQAPMSNGASMGRPMGRMGGSAAASMNSMGPRSSLPGFPGATHLYHVGETGFFLDHPQHITLSTEQQTALNRIKERALLDQAGSERRIEDTEQELWTLTAADSPDIVKVDTKVRAIEKLRGDQRMAFIRAVGEAAKTLTPDQQAALLGLKSRATGSSTMGAKPPAGGEPMPKKDM